MGAQDTDEASTETFKGFRIQKEIQKDKNKKKECQCKKLKCYNFCLVFLDFFMSQE